MANRSSPEYHAQVATLTRERRSEVSDIGFPPAGLHTDEREASRLDLPLFLRTFMVEKFYRDFDPDMLHALDRVQTAILEHGVFAEAMPRGKGKTTTAEGAMIWAAAYGHRACMMIIASDQAKANDIISNIQSVCEGQCEKFCEAFPEIHHPVYSLEGRNQRAQSQHIAGTPTNMTWKADKIVFPTVGEQPSSGIVIQAKGITAKGIRGYNHHGKRPDFVLMDDPQDDESAVSEDQNKKREKIVLGTVMGLAGHDKKISAVMTCTVIAYDDLAERFLDRENHPEWQGYRTKLVDAWPKAKRLWDKYADIWREDIQEGKGIGRATEHYRDNQAAMDKGAKLCSTLLYDKDCEISAVQHAFNLRLEVGETAFESEYQNQPKTVDVSIYDISPALIQSRIAERSVLTVPDWAKVSIVATDINQYGLHSSMVAFGNDQTAGVIWYGRLDKKGRPLAPKNTPELQKKQLIYEALVRHGEMITAAKKDIDGWLIDGGWLHDVVQRYVAEVGKSLPFPVAVCRGFSADRYRPVGKGTIGAPKEQCHLTESQMGRFIAYNQHYWCEVAQRAWLGSVGAPGSCSLFKKTKGDHSEFAEQICREKLIEKFDGKAGTVWVWHSQPGWHDYGDAMYMAYVGAAWLGIGTAGTVPVKAAQRRRAVRHIPV